MSLRKAFTLIELIVVLCVVAALAGLTLPLVNDTLSTAASTTTHSTLQQISRSIRDYWNDTKLVVLDGNTSVANESNRFGIRWLFKNPVTDNTTNSFDPNTKIGWNGPYLLSATGIGANANDLTLVDGWNHAIVVQDIAPSTLPREIRVVSAGPNGIVDIPANVATSSLNAQQIGDDLYVTMQLR